MTSSTGNHLLDRLSQPLRETILRSATAVDLPFRAGLYSSDSLPANLHFITSGLASVVVNMKEGGTSEVTMSGKEGLTGSTLLLGPQKSVADCYMQIGGSGLRVPLRLMQSLFDDVPEFRQQILALAQANLNISMQLTACGRLHEAEARLARWILMTADRTGTDNMPLTQEVLAEMLGTQRTTVALVAGTLKRAGMIDYTRGKVRILDRAGLTQAACECYQVASEAVLALSR